MIPTSHRPRTEGWTFPAWIRRLSTHGPPRRGQVGHPEPPVPCVREAATARPGRRRDARACPPHDRPPRLDASGSNGPSASSRGRAASTWSPGRCSARCRSWRDRVRAPPPADPAHLGLADPERERLAGSTRRPRGVARPRGAGRRAVLDPHAGGRRRHARPRQGGADGAVPDPAAARRPPGPRHLAGDLPLRAPRPRRARSLVATAFGEAAAT